MQLVEVYASEEVLCGGVGDEQAPAENKPAACGLRTSLLPPDCNRTAGEMSAVPSSTLRLLAVLLILLPLGPSCCCAQGPLQEVSAVVGGTALLPCDIVPPLPNDSVILVIWFKNEVTPIYSYDIRGKHSELASHWRDRELLQQRGYFRTITEPATLALDDVRAEDEGDFRCRVDFRRSPTRNSKVRLNVVVPPQMPTIIDERGRELPSVAGPYTEGSSMKLTCVVRGGRPSPAVRWWRGERLLDAHELPSPFPQVRQSQLLVEPLTRADLHSVYTCQATNSALTPPASARVSLEMHLRPLGATIITPRQPLSAGRRFEVDCMASGSRPAAKLSWWLDNQALVGSVDKILGEGNVTTSTVRLTPTAADNGKTLTCRAENPSLPAGVEEDTWRLDVHFEPVLRLQLGANLNPDDIEEGDDVYFECKVHANPYAYKVIWKHNGRIVQHSPKAGVLLMDRDLALQGVRREQAGNYSCFASNVEGDGESNAVPLRVMYAPVCRPEQRRVYAVARLERAHVKCEVDAYPRPDSFRWSFNHSGAGDAAVELPDTHYSSTPDPNGASTLSYAPASELDYGTLLCLAANTAGQQREPCVFHIVAAGHPEPPLNCSLSNQTTGSLEVECEEGFDGGLPQTFQLEVFDLESGLLAANVSSRWPRFLVEGLRAGRVLRVHAYALNAKGRSEPFALEGFTLKQAEKRTGSPVALELTPLLATLLGALAALLLVGAAVVAALRVRARTGGGGGGGVARPAALALKEKAAAAAAAAAAAGGRQPLRSDAGADGDRDEKNPDVIPCTTDSEYAGAETPGPLQALLSPTFAAPTAAEAQLRNGDLRSAFKGGGAGQPPPPRQAARAPRSGAPGDEVQYAELRLPRPGSASSPLCAQPPPPPLDASAASALYAQIDHARWGAAPTRSSTAALPPGAALPCREVVTVRTPLMMGDCAQESCV